MVLHQHTVSEKNSKIVLTPAAIEVTTHINDTTTTSFFLPLLVHKSKGFVTCTDIAGQPLSCDL